MADPDWYEVTKGDVVLQGDILFDCPVVVTPHLPWPVPEGYQPPIDLNLYDLVVLTQSCDLQNNKVEEVLFAPVLAWSKIVQSAPKESHYRSSKFRQVLVEGSAPGMSLLYKREGNPALDWSVVDFRRLFVIQKNFVLKFAEAAGPRLRLRSPYREHLAQAFARYFMRVGLPHDASAFVKEGNVV